MDVEQFSEQTAEELFGVVLPVVMALLILVLVVFDGAIALYAGLLVGVGLVLVGGVLSYRDVRQRNNR